MRQQVRQVVLSVEEGDRGWPPIGVDDFIAWLGKIKESVPEEKKFLLQMEIEANGYYDGDFNAQITIFYMREENDEEYYRRTHKQEYELRQREAYERQEYLRLKQKYGDKS